MLFSEKDTLIRVLTPLVIILLVSKLSASLTTNTVIPCRDSLFQKGKTLKTERRVKACLDSSEVHHVLREPKNQGLFQR